MQNVFANGQYFRIISLNTEYFLLFKQNRDQSQMLALAKQSFPGQVSYFMDSYKKGHAKSFRISAYRADPKTLRYKLRSNIIPGRLMSVFLLEKVAGTKWID